MSRVRAGTLALRVTVPVAGSVAPSRRPRKTPDGSSVALTTEIAKQLGQHCPGRRRPMPTRWLWVLTAAAKERSRKHGGNLAGSAKTRSAPWLQKQVSEKTRQDLAMSSSIPASLAPSLIPSLLLRLLAPVLVCHAQHRVTLSCRCGDWFARYLRHS